MRDGNKETVFWYVFETVVWSFFALTAYRSWCFVNFRMPKTGEILGYYESWQLLVGFFMVLTGIGTLVTLRRRRRTLCAVVNIVTPLEIYLLPTVAYYCPVLVWAAAGTLVSALVFYAWVIFRKSPGSLRRKCAWYFHGSRVFIGMILLPVLIYMVGMSHGEISVAEASMASDAVQEEDTIRNHLAELCLLADPDWASVSLEEKAELLQTVASIEARYLGLKRIPQVKVSCLTANMLGKYDPSEETVYISADLLTLGPAETAMETILHELYHAYQHQLVDAYLNVPEVYQNMRVFQKARTYEEEFRDYVDGMEDYEDYASQSVEADAREYAEEGVREYSDRILEYLEAKEEENKEKQE